MPWDVLWWALSKLDVEKWTRIKMNSMNKSGQKAAMVWSYRKNGKKFLA